MKRIRAELVGHLGGEERVSAVQRQLIARVAILTLYTSKFDERALARGGLSERDSHQYLAYSNSLTRALAQLGLKGVAAKPASLGEYLAAKAAQRLAGEEMEDEAAPEATGANPAGPEPATDAGEDA